MLDDGMRWEMAKLDAAQIAFRASTEMLEAIDREVERVAAERPGEEVTRSDVVRAIIHRALLGGSGTLEQKVATLPGEGLGVKVYRTVLGESGTTEQKVATLPGEGDQPGFDQVFLAAVQHNGRARTHHLTDEIHIAT